MSGPANIDSWFEFVIWMMIAGGSVAAATMGAVAMVRSGRNSAHAQEAATDARVVREQVQNDHQTNLRDDLDRTTAKVETVDSKVDRLAGVLESMERQQNAFMREIRKQTNRQDVIAQKYHPEEYS